MNPSEFEALKPDEQAKVFHQTSFKERGELLRYSHQPERLVQSLSQEEFYLLTREMDPEEKSDAVRYANLGQIFFMADIDCWQQDRFDSKKFVTWLETLERADDRRLLGWLAEADYEAVITGFKKIVRVIKPDREYAADEILGDTPFFTIDQMYYVAVEEQNLETVRHALEVLFENQRGRYFALLEGILSEMDDELEEEAYRLRETRLAQRGFPDFETAHQLLRPITRVEFENFPAKKNEKSAKAGREAEVIPAYPVLWRRQGLFLDEVLEILRADPAADFEALQEEMAWVTNKVIALEGFDFSSEEKVRQGAERARFYVSIGLESLSGRKAEAAADLLKTKWVEIIFRWGISQALRVREQALAVMRAFGGVEASREVFVRFLNPPYELIFRGLFQTVPQYSTAGEAGALEPLRDFSSLAEIAAARLSVEQIGAVLKSLLAGFPKAPGWLDAAADPESDMNLFAVLGTLMVSLETGRPSPEPAAEKNLQKFLESGFELRGSRYYLKTGLREKLIRYCFPEESGTDMRGFWGLFFDEFEEELGGLDRTKPVRPEFISLVRISRAAGPKAPASSTAGGRRKGPRP